MYKKDDLLFDFVSEEKITLFGVSAKYIDALSNKNVIPKKNSYTPVGDNSITKKVLKWKIKKNIFKAAQEINSLKR